MKVVKIVLGVLFGLVLMYVSYISTGEEYGFKVEFLNHLALRAGESEFSLGTVLLGIGGISLMLLSLPWKGTLRLGQIGVVVSLIFLVLEFWK